MVILNTDRYIYPTFDNRTLMKAIDYRNDIREHSIVGNPYTRMYHSDPEAFVDPGVSKLFGADWRSLITPWRTDRPGTYQFTREGETMRNHILKGYVYDWQRKMRDIKETERFLVEIFETASCFSNDIFGIIENLPMKIFENVHCAALTFRMAAERDGHIWRRANAVK